MRTRFAPAQLADPAMAASEAVIRKCVHCGFCTATCPTYVLLGDELDSPRGRIYLIKDMLENERDPTAEVVKHIDRCLSCLSCMTTCPSGVNYMHLVDHARAYIAERYTRPWPDRLYRALLIRLLPFPERFRLALRLARLAQPLVPILPGWAALKPITAMLALVPRALPTPIPAVDAPVRAPRGKVVFLQGCAEPVLRPEYRAAAIRLINRAGYDVLFADGEGCCGALVHHMGEEHMALVSARRNIDAWSRLAKKGELSAIVTTTSGCGTTIKNYGYLLRDDPDYADKAERLSALSKDISEFLASIELPEGRGPGLVVAYHPACSLQHGQKVTREPRQLLEAAGFTVRSPAGAHLCCGSAGTYNILQPDIAAQLGDRKAATLEAVAPDVIATGNIGCAVQIGGRTGVPVVHMVELLDWATGGPIPVSLQGIRKDRIQ